MEHDSNGKKFGRHRIGETAFWTLFAATLLSPLIYVVHPALADWIAQHATTSDLVSDLAGALHQQKVVRNVCTASMSGLFAVAFVISDWNSRRCWQGLLAIGFCLFIMSGVAHY